MKKKPSKGLSILSSKTLNVQKELNVLGGDVPTLKWKVHITRRALSPGDCRAVEMIFSVGNLEPAVIYLRNDYEQVTKLFERFRSLT